MERYSTRSDHCWNDRLSRYHIEIAIFASLWRWLEGLLTSIDTFLRHRLYSRLEVVLWVSLKRQAVDIIARTRRNDTPQHQKIAPNFFRPAPKLVIALDERGRLTRDHLARSSVMSAAKQMQHRRAHNLLLISKLLNCRENASPFTLILDSLEQSGKGLVREFIRRANVRLHTRFSLGHTLIDIPQAAKTRVVFVSFETLKKPKGVDVFIAASRKDPSSLQKELSKLAAESTARQSMLLKIYPLPTEPTANHRRHRNPSHPRHPPPTNLAPQHLSHSPPIPVFPTLPIHLSPRHLPRRHPPSRPCQRQSLRAPPPHAPQIHRHHSPHPARTATRARCQGRPGPQRGGAGLRAGGGD